MDRFRVAAKWTFLVSGHGGRSLEAFALGAMAKWVATVSAYPVQVAQTDSILPINTRQVHRLDQMLFFND